MGHQSQQSTGKSVAARCINEKLENIKTNIGKQYQRICDRDAYVTAEKVRNAWMGFGDGYRLLLQTFDEYLEEFARKRVGKDRAASTLENYTRARNYLAAFLRYAYKLEDIPFMELKREFIEKYVVYLSTVQGYASGSILTPVKKLKLMTYTAFRNGWIVSDPFAGFHFNATYRDRRFLSESELRAARMRNSPTTKPPSFGTYGLVFCCFTGLAYADVKKLTHNDIHTDERGDSGLSTNDRKRGHSFGSNYARGQRTRNTLPPPEASRRQGVSGEGP
ncbi:MAG: phage integrase SAM-like domain-containing protein [Alistipes indistinctus]